MNKFINPESLRNRNFTLSFVNGCFDILHPEHIKLIKFAKTKSDKVMVAVNDDDSVRRLKGFSRPINPLDHRMFILSELQCVDFVASFDEDTPLEIIKRVMPDCIIKGSDYVKEDVVGYEQVNGNVFLYTYVPGISTTKIVEKIRQTA